MRNIRNLCLTLILIFSFTTIAPAYAHAATISGNSTSQSTANSSDMVLQPYGEKLPNPIKSTIFTISYFIVQTLASKIISDELDMTNWYNSFIGKPGKESDPDDSTNTTKYSKALGRNYSFDINVSSNFVGYSRTNNPDRVRDVQTALNYWNNNSAVAVDGAFGSQTYNAIKAYQMKLYLYPDGVVGPTTWKNLLGDGK